MKTLFKYLWAAAATLGWISTTCGISACDDGNLNTVTEQETLPEYMEAHPELRLYLNAVSNYREPVYLCIYDMTNGSVLTPTPLSRYGSADGIPYGEISAVEVTEAYASLSEDAMVEEIFVTDGLSPCPATRPTEGLGAMPMNTAGDDDASMIRIVEGLLAASDGGEEWMLCGDTGDGPCSSTSGLGSAGVGLLPNSPLDPSQTTIHFFQIADRFTATDKTYTFCWAGTDGTRFTVGPYPVPYEPPYRGWFDVDPLLSGAILLFGGEVDCTAADPATAITSTPIPAEATFGPDGSTVQFEAGSAGDFLIIGQSLPGIPAEAGLKVIPILHWSE